jgi:hypothetical protein
VQAGGLPRASSPPLLQRRGHAVPGTPSSDIRAISQGAQRLARSIARSLFAEDAGRHAEALEVFSGPEQRGDEWPDRRA